MQKRQEFYRVRNDECKDQSIDCWIKGESKEWNNSTAHPGCLVETAESPLLRKR